MRVIIAGNGIAGINVASALRADPSVEVVVYGRESHPFYSRVRLIEVLAGASEPEAIHFYKPEWYAKKGITVHSGIEVVAMDPAAKTARLSDGSTVAWDFFVFATGAVSNRPPIPGSELGGVFTMRTMDDVAAIRRSLAARPADAAVIGGGLLGLEAARALRDAGASRVRVFELASRLLPRQLDEVGAELLRERLAASGLEIVCGAETAAFDPSADDSTRAGSIRLKDGRTFPSSTTILSMGVHSEVTLAKAAGCAVNRGIVVDERLRTSVSGVYAVGDCAEYGGIVWGIIPAALEQAPICAASILAAAACRDCPESYAQTVPKTALKVGGIELMSLGKAVLTAEEAASGRWVERSRVWPDRSRYEKYVLEPAPAGGHILAGAILYGSKQNQAQAQKLSGKPITDAEVAALLAG